MMAAQGSQPPGQSQQAGAVYNGPVHQTYHTQAMPPPGVHVNATRNLSGSTAFESDSDFGGSDAGSQPFDAPFSPITIGINAPMSISGSRNSLIIPPETFTKLIYENVLRALRDASAGEMGIPMIDQDGRPRPINIDITAGITIDGDCNFIGKSPQFVSAVDVPLTGDDATQQVPNVDKTRDATPDQASQDEMRDEEPQREHCISKVITMKLKKPATGAGPHIERQRAYQASSRAYTLPIGTPRPMATPHSRNAHSLGGSFSMPLAAMPGRIEADTPVPNFDAPGANTPLPVDFDMGSVSAFGLRLRSVSRSSDEMIPLVEREISDEREGTSTPLFAGSPFTNMMMNSGPPRLSTIRKGAAMGLTYNDVLHARLATRRETTEESWPDYQSPAPRPDREPSAELEDYETPVPENAPMQFAFGMSPPNPSSSKLAKRRTLPGPPSVSRRSITHDDVVMGRTAKRTRSESTVDDIDDGAEQKRAKFAEDVKTEADERVIKQEDSEHEDIDTYIRYQRFGSFGTRA